MSKYTTEVRFICENKSGLNDSVGANDVDNVIDKSWDKIFTSKVALFDEAYRSVICKKILKHYYLREIGSETVGVWLLWMNTRFEEIMPYYNQLYKSELIKFDPMRDVDVTRKHNRVTDETNTNTRESTSNGTNTGSSSETVNRNSSANNNRKDLYSDTPQGALTGVESETYLTNARKITDENTETNNENRKSDSSNESKFNENVSDKEVANSTEDYLESVVGKQGGESFSSLLLKYRETFLNIDMQVIEEFSDLFMGLW